MIDVVIVSDSKNDELIKLTEQTIDTCIKDKFVDKVIIVEQNEDINYNGHNIKTVHCNAPFNYNNRLNFGYEFTVSPYVAFCNNDLIFGQDWALNIIRAMGSNGCESASPYCPKAHKKVMGDTKGWKVRINFAGWCFVWKRSLYNAVGGLSEDYSYWCSDNVAAEQAKKVGAKHILVKDSVVEHLSNQTGKTIDNATMRDYTWKQAQKFEREHNQMLFPKVFYDRNLK